MSEHHVCIPEREALTQALIVVEEDKLAPCIGGTCGHADDDPAHFTALIGCSDADAIIDALKELAG